MCAYSVRKLAPLTMVGFRIITKSRIAGNMLNIIGECLILAFRKFIRLKKPCMNVFPGFRIPVGSSTVITLVWWSWFVILHFVFSWWSQILNCHSLGLCNTCYRLEPPIHHAPTEYDQIYRLLTGYNSGCQGVLAYISNNSTKISNKGAKTSNPPNNEKLPWTMAPPWGYSPYKPLQFVITLLNLCFVVN